MKRTKKYFPNRWQLIKDIPIDKFTDIDWGDFYEGRVLNWELNKNVHSLIRTYNNKTGKVKEYAYKQKSAAINRWKKLITDDDLEVTYVNDEVLDHLSIKELFNVN